MKIIYERKIRRVIITEGDNLVGIVTEHDILKLLMNNKDLLSNVVEGKCTYSSKSGNRRSVSHFWLITLF